MGGFHWRIDRSIRLATTALTPLATFIPSLALAQVVMDGTAGPGGALIGPDYAITDDLGTRAGDNLFHSFLEFSLATGESATFSGPDAIQNVISRVTGDNPSNIDGTVASTMPEADFYFINPNGVTFGPNATLDVQGSFHVSTADELRLDDGQVYSGTNPVAPNGLLVAEPRAFGFYDAPVGNIEVNRSTLQVGEGETLSLVGGDITVDGGAINAEAGTINLLALDGEGEADVTTGGVSGEELGNISLANQALVDVNGDGAGTIKLRSHDLTIENGSLLTSRNTGPLDSNGVIDAQAGSVNLRNGSTIRADVNASGKGADIVVESDSVIMDGASFIRTVSLSGEPGDIVITTGYLAVRDGSIIVNTFARTNADSSAGGLLLIEATEAVDIIGGGPNALSGILNETRGERNGSDLIIRTPEFRMGRYATITTSTSGNGDAGSVTIEVDNLEIDVGDGQGTVGITSGSFGISLLGPTSTGVAGNITIVAENSITLSGNPNNTDAGASILSGTSTAGDGGSIRIEADRIELSHGSTITAVSVGSGDAGDINLVASDQLTMENQSSVNTISLASGGGLIDIEVGELIYLVDSAIASSVIALSGDAGNISIDPKFLILDNSSILARADSGVGGDIEIVADNLILSPRSLINAEAGEEGIDGTVVTSTPEVDLSSGIVILDNQFADASRLLRERCETGGNLGGSTFVTSDKSPTITSGDGLLPGFYAVVSGADEGGNGGVSPCS